MSLFNELKRRNVFRVALAYLAVSWLLIQVSDVVIPALGLPAGIVTWAILLFAIGLPIVLLISWFYELTPGGLVRESEILAGTSIAPATGRKLDFLIIAALAMALGYFIWESRFSGDTGTEEAAAIPDKSIAVLPFENNSADAENAAFFADGLHDELLTLLSRLGDLRVISRTSVERLDRDLRIPEIATLLGVATVLEGKVQRAGDRLRINVQLIDAVDEGHLWANTYDRELSAANVFDVQSDIARSISEALHAQLSVGDEKVLSEVPTGNTQALNQYLLGRDQLRRYSFESLRQSLEHFRQATELDPGYAEAWIAIADASSMRLQTGAIEVQEYLATAGSALAQALELDPKAPKAHAQLARLRWRSGDLAGADDSFRKALDLNPRAPDNLVAYGEYLRSTDRPAEAIPVLERALEGDPLSVNILFELGKTEMYLGHPERTVAYGHRSLKVDPASPLGYGSLVQANLWHGRYDQMWPWFVKFFDADPEDYENWAHLALYSQQLDAPDWADRYLQRALGIGPDEPAVLKCQAQVLAMRGERDAALTIARGALEAGLDERWFSTQVFLRIVRDAALESGDFESAIQWYRARHPELFETEPVITIDNVNEAADLALLLQRSGSESDAAGLVEAALAWHRRTQPAGVHGYLVGIVDVELLALKGQVADALRILQAAADAGWGAVWSWDTTNENLAVLRNEPQFQAVTEQLQREMARQREAIRQLPPMGPYDLRQGSGVSG